MTPFTKLCSYACILSLTLLVVLLFYFRVQRTRGKSTGPVLLIILLLTLVFFASAVTLAVLAA